MIGYSQENYEVAVIMLIYVVGIAGPIVIAWKIGVMYGIGLFVCLALLSLNSVIQHKKSDEHFRVVECGDGYTIKYLINLVYWNQWVTYQQCSIGMRGLLFWDYKCYSKEEAERRINMIKS